MEIPTLDSANDGSGGVHGRATHDANSRSKKKEKKRIEDCYVMGDDLGKGAFGVVKRCQNLETKVWYAVKIIDKTKAGAAGMSEIFSEVEIVSLLSHRYIIELYEVFETKETLFLIMELLIGGELEGRLRQTGSFSEATTKRLARNLLLAVEYIHRKGIVHRDLKPQNMLLAFEHESSEVKLADFGLSVLIGNDSCLLSCCGTTAYMAPEILNGEAYGKSVDMWSVGVIVYHLLSGAYPFSGSNAGEMTANIMRGVFRIPEDGPWSDITPGAKDVIRRLLEVDPKKRIGAAECLNHPWVRNGAEDDMDLIMQIEEPSAIPSQSAKRRFRCTALMMLAAHRLLVLQRYSHLRRLGVDCALMYNLGNIVWRSFDCRDVDCNEIPIGNKGLPLLLDMVTNSPCVEGLYFANNDLNYDSIQGIVKTATAHPSLTVLDLSHNPVTQTGGRALLRLARTNHRIRGIKLIGTQVNTELITQINAALKDNEKKKGHKDISALSTRLSTPLPSMHGGTHNSRTSSPCLVPSSAPIARPLHPENVGSSTSSIGGNSLPFMPSVPRKHGGNVGHRPVTIKLYRANTQ